VVTPGLEWDLAPFLWTVAILTMIVGTVLAIVQTDMKRTLAYSSIAHAGFLLLGVIALDERGIGGVLFYLLAYGLATVGAFGLVSLVRIQDADGTIAGEAGHLSQWAGLGRRSPVLAVCFSLFLLSFAGIPLTAGFTGKFAVFSAAVSQGWAWLAVVGVLASAVTAYIYFKVVVLMWLGERTGDTVVVRPSWMTSVAILVGVAITLALGIMPSPLLDLAQNTAAFLR
jgi:NADH-quinone oxidoreductase subunit N